MLTGSFVAIVTPFKDGEVDYESLKSLIDFQIENGTDWIVPCGTTGESPTLSFSEHQKVVETTVTHVAGRAKVLAGSGSNNSAEAITLSKHAQEVGANGLLVITPYYNKPTQDGLFQHFKEIANNVSIPIVLYNVPSRTGVNMGIETIIKLSKIENIQAIKEASGNLEKVSEILIKTTLNVLSGEDNLTYPMLALGAHGVISVSANIAPRLLSDMVHSALDGNFIKARDIHNKLFELTQILFCETNPVPVKAALALAGRIKNELRLPLVKMTESNQQVLESYLRELDLI